MPKYKDIVGQRFNRLTVIERTDQRANNGQVIWLCQCDCGNKTKVRGDSLRNRHATSCGCFQREQASAASFIDITGQRFGRLIVIGKATEKTKDNHLRWLCKCDCGNETTVTGSALGSDRTKSCGCLPKGGSKPIHGLSDTRAWERMIRDCYNPKSLHYKNYGARGIKVSYDPWRLGLNDTTAFECFVENMGLKPKGLFLDRINNNGNYEPGNCHWTTPSQSVSNRRRWIQRNLGITAAVFKLINQAGRPLRCKQITTVIKAPYDNIISTLAGLVKQGKIARIARGQYASLAVARQIRR